MKILKPGTSHTAWTYEFTCTSCGAVCCADATDIQRTEGFADPREPSAAYPTYHVRCPTPHCNKTFMLKDLPDVVRSFVDAQHSSRPYDR